MDLRAAPVHWILSPSCSVFKPAFLIVIFVIFVLRYAMFCFGLLIGRVTLVIRRSSPLLVHFDKHFVELCFIRHEGTISIHLYFYLIFSLCKQQ